MLTSIRVGTVLELSPGARDALPYTPSRVTVTSVVARRPGAWVLEWGEVLDDQELQELIESARVHPLPRLCYNGPMRLNLNGLKFAEVSTGYYRALASDAEKNFDMTDGKVTEQMAVEVIVATNATTAADAGNQSRMNEWRTTTAGTVTLKEFTLNIEGATKNVVAQVTHLA